MCRSYVGKIEVPRKMKLKEDDRKVILSCYMAVLLELVYDCEDAVANFFDSSDAVSLMILACL